MKKTFYGILFAISFFQLQKLKGQCSFKPTISSSNLVFCPGGTDTLSTQEYDSYQWLKNNKPIKGATHRTLIVHQQQDEGFYFSVAAVKNGCTDTSKQVFAGAYAFFPPILIEGGDIGVLNPNLDALIECPNDTLILTLGSPYTVNVQWYNFKKPLSGANASTYYVTKTGSYTVCGAPSFCPNFTQCESLPLNAIFENPKVDVTQNGDTLFASGHKKYYQWYMLKNAISGANQSYFIPKSKGVYTVVAYDNYNCKAVSKPYLFIRRQENIISVSPNPVQNLLHVHVNSNNAKQIVIADLSGAQLLKQEINSTDAFISLQNIHAGTYVVQVLDKNKSITGSAIILKQ